MNNFPIALQLYSVRDDMEKDFEGTLKAVKEMGYDGVEFAGLFGHSAEEVKEMCDRIGLVPLSAHVPFVDMMGDASVMETYKKIGCSYVVIPYLTEDLRPGEPGFMDVISGAEKLAADAAGYGMKLGYHNHDFEFTKIGDEYAIDILYNTVPALYSEFDVCWVQVGGENPAAYIRKYADRTEIIHLKDYTGEKTENMYALIGLDEGEKKEHGAFSFMPLGRGKVNRPAVLEAAKDVDAKWVIVEQDEPSCGLTPLECAKASIEYLKSL